MNRIFRLFLSFCMVFCLLPTPAYATNNTAYVLKDLGMRMEIPSEFVVFTRDTDADDPNLSAQGLTEEGLSSFMEEEHIYLDAWDENINYEIIVSKESSPIPNYAQFNDAELNVLLSFFEDKFTAAGDDFIGAGIYRHKQTPFMKIYASVSDDEGTTYTLEYHTVHDNQAINIVLYSYIGKINSDMEALMQTIIDSVYFDASLRGRRLIKKTESFLYADPESGLSFTVPECWIESPQFADPEYVNVAFESIREDGLYILFGREDMLSEKNWDGSKLARIITPRASLDQSSLTEYDLASSLGCSEEDISTFPYAGREYYVVESVLPLTVNSVTFTIPTTCLIRCESGYMYMFFSTITKDSPHFTDLEQLVRSVEYPVVEDEFLSQRKALGIALVSLVIVLIVGIALWTHRKKQHPQVCTPSNSDTQDSHKAALPVDTPASAPEAPIETGASQILFCHRCGCRIVQGAHFCHRCGTLLAKE